MLYQKFNQLLWQIYTCPNLFQFIIVLRIRLSLIQFFVLHEHDCDCQIEQEKGANDNAAYKIEYDEGAVVAVFKYVHDLCPALHGDALENSQESHHDIVEAGDSVVKVVYFRVALQVCKLFGPVAWELTKVKCFVS